MGRVEGKVALVTGAAGGQGRSHAVTLAREGAQVVVIDICEQVPTVAYEMPTPADLEETVRLVEEQGQRCIGIKADVRDADQMQGVLDRTIEELGRIDIVAGNHGIVHHDNWEGSSDEIWRDSYETNVLGMWHAIKPAIPHMIEQGGGSIIMTSSVAGIRPMRGLYSYSAAKHGVIGLMHALAADLGQHSIRVNVVCPGNTFTRMLDNPSIWEAFAGGKKGATKEDGRFAAESFHLLPVPWAMPDAISNAVLFLASDEAKHITGITVPVDSGMSHQPPGTPLNVTTRLAELENAAES